MQYESGLKNKEGIALTLEDILTGPRWAWLDVFDGEGNLIGWAIADSVWSIKSIKSGRYRATLYNYKTKRIRSPKGVACFFLDVNPCRVEMGVRR